jgi:hypothetical protein
MSPLSYRVIDKGDWTEVAVLPCQHRVGWYILIVEMFVQYMVRYTVKIREITQPI